MIRIFANANYDFLGYRRIAYFATGFFVVPAMLILLVFRGLNYSIEFTGGTLVQVAATRVVSASDLRAALARGGLAGAEIQAFGSPRDFVIRARLSARGTVDQQEAQRTSARVTETLTQEFGADAFTVERVEAVGPKVGGELRQKALGAILLSFLATLVYLAFRFELRFGVAAVLATAHDILATLAFVTYMNLEVSLVVVGGILTVVGYSLNDTIVIFDRVRENLHKYKRDDFAGILGRSVNETLPRTVMTGGTVIVALLALLALAGEVIRPFAWVMVFGVFTGTFSSIFIAAPILLAIERRWPGKDARGVKARVAPAGAAGGV
ncbi:MAG: protein translocase subunit SecF [Gemmatimonadetes bacterium]|nr:protein translocase subunit SecF [Gemmatimonadota bacterium]